MSSGTLNVVDPERSVFCTSLRENALPSILLTLRAKSGTGVPSRRCTLITTSTSRTAIAGSPTLHTARTLVEKKAIRVRTSRATSTFLFFTQVPFWIKEKLLLGKCSKLCWPLKDGRWHHLNSTPVKCHRLPCSAGCMCALDPHTSHDRTDFPAAMQQPSVTTRASGPDDPARTPCLRALPRMPNAAPHQAATTSRTLIRGAKLPQHDTLRAHTLRNLHARTTFVRSIHALSPDSACITPDILRKCALVARHESPSSSVRFKRRQLGCRVEGDKAPIAPDDRANTDLVTTEPATSGLGVVVHAPACTTLEEESQPLTDSSWTKPRCRAQARQAQARQFRCASRLPTPLVRAMCGRSSHARGN